MPLTRAILVNSHETPTPWAAPPLAGGTHLRLRRLPGPADGPERVRRGPLGVRRLQPLPASGPVAGPHPAADGAVLPVGQALALDPGPPRHLGGGSHYGVLLEPALAP